MGSIGAVVAGLVVLGLVVAGLTGLAVVRGLSPWAYWAVPAGAVLPWVAVFILITWIASTFFKGEAAQGVGMTALWAFLGGGLSLLAGLAAGFAIGPEVGLLPRFLWAAGVSGAFALLVLGIVLYAAFFG